MVAAAGADFSNWSESYFTNEATLAQVKSDLTYAPVGHNHEGDAEGWTPVGLTSTLPSADGKYYLIEDIKLSDTWALTNCNITLCLNGYDIIGDGADYLVELKASQEGSLTICDCCKSGTLYPTL